MKKLLAVLMALLCLGASAYAEEVPAAEDAADETDTLEEAVDNGIYMTSITNPDGDTVADVYMDELPDDSQLTFDPEAGEDGMWLVDIAGVANIHVYISKIGMQESEGVSLADVSGDAMEQLQIMATEDYDDPVVELLTTPSGNQYMHIYERSEDMRSVCTMFTLYKGVVIQLIQYNDDFSPLTENDHQMMEDVLYSIWVYDVK